MDEQPNPRWRGINHLALVCSDMDATVRFYVGVLGARLVATVGTPDFRHYFFEIGVGNTIAFFEYSGRPARALRQAGRHPERPRDAVRPPLVRASSTRRRCWTCAPGSRRPAAR